MTPNLKRFKGIFNFCMNSLEIFSGKIQILFLYFLCPIDCFQPKKRFYLECRLKTFFKKDFLKEDDYVAVKRYGKVHGNSVKSMKYIEESQLLISCSKDPNASVLLKHIESKNPTMSYKVPKASPGLLTQLETKNTLLREQTALPLVHQKSSWS